MQRGRAPGSTKDDDEAKTADVPTPGRSTLVDATAGATPPAPVVTASEIKPDATAASTAQRKRKLDEDVGPRWSSLRTFAKRRSGRDEDEDETKSDEEKEAENETQDAAATEQTAADQESTTEKADEADAVTDQTNDPRPG